ncbi:MAG: hypothetical protein DRN81_06380 [Thermoproteota archaeon]|nr:MAG: hypothetical protein DRN81_06380 [Candidatus Korarchaeota archaeon]
MWKKYIDEEWKHICYIYLGDDIYMYETKDKKAIEDFAKFNPAIRKWLLQHRSDDICLAIEVYPELELTMYAIGIRKIDVDEDIDNRVYFESDYEQVIEWLEKRAKKEKRIKTGKSEEP